MYKDTNFYFEIYKNKLNSSLKIKIIFINIIYIINSLFGKFNSIIIRKNLLINFFFSIIYKFFFNKSYICTIKYKKNIFNIISIPIIVNINSFWKKFLAIKSNFII